MSKNFDFYSTPKTTFLSINDIYMTDKSNQLNKKIHNEEIDPVFSTIVNTQLESLISIDNNSSFNFSSDCVISNTSNKKNLHQNHSSNSSEKLKSNCFDVDAEFMILIKNENESNLNLNNDYDVYEYSKKVNNKTNLISDFKVSKKDCLSIDADNFEKSIFKSSPDYDNTNIFDSNNLIDFSNTIDLKSLNEFEIKTDFENTKMCQLSSLNLTSKHVPHNDSEKINYINDFNNHVSLTSVNYEQLQKETDKTNLNHKKKIDESEKKNFLFCSKNNISNHLIKNIDSLNHDKTNKISSELKFKNKNKEINNFLLVLDNKSQKKKCLLHNNIKDLKNDCFSTDYNQNIRLLKTDNFFLNSLNHNLKNNSNSNLIFSDFEDDSMNNVTCFNLLLFSTDDFNKNSKTSLNENHNYLLSEDSEHFLNLNNEKKKINQLENLRYDLNNSFHNQDDVLENSNKIICENECVFQKNDSKCYLNSLATNNSNKHINYIFPKPFTKDFYDLKYTKFIPLSVLKKEPKYKLIKKSFFATDSKMIIKKKSMDQCIHNNLMKKYEYGSCRIIHNDNEIKIGNHDHKLIDTNENLADIKKININNYKNNRYYSRLNIYELSHILELNDYNIQLTKKIEYNILEIFKNYCGFKLGYQTWVRDTKKVQRTELIQMLSKFTQVFYPEIDKFKLEIIVRRGSYSLMQNRLRKEKRVLKMKTLKV